MRSRWRNYSAWTAFLDLLFNCLLAFCTFFMLSFLLINPKVKHDKNVEAKAEVMITVTWPSANKDDVDTYVEDPIGSIVFFQRKEDGLMHLDRDDLGHDNDKIVTPTGTYEYKQNREIVTLRGLIPGEYVVNVHMYSKRQPDPVEVTIILEKINPSVKLCAAKTVTLLAHGDEKTAFRFTVNKEGEITHISHLHKRLAGPLVGDRGSGRGPVPNYEDQDSGYGEYGEENWGGEDDE